MLWVSYIQHMLAKPIPDKEILHLPHVVYIATLPCCKQPGSKKIDIYFTGFLFDWREKNWHAYWICCFCISTNANAELVVETKTIHTYNTDVEMGYVCVSYSSFCYHSLTCVEVHEQAAKIERAHFANRPQFQFPVTEAHIHCYVRGSVPKSQLHFQEPPLEWQEENLLCSPLYGCDGYSSQYIDIYIVFPLGCSPGSQGVQRWWLGEVWRWRADTFMCNAVLFETLSIITYRQWQISNYLSIYNWCPSFCVTFWSWT